MQPNLLNQFQKEFEALYDLYQEYNSHTNLSSIRDKEDVFKKHFQDSLTCYDLVKDSKTLIDIGTGGGFPALVLAIVLPDLRITAVDSIGKKIKFIELVKDKLKLKNLTPLQARAEIIAQDKAFRERFDICTSRAVAQLNILLELTLPFVKVNGKMIAFKKFPIQEELAKSKKACKTLGGEKIQEIVYEDEKQLLIYKKVLKTPSQYPRDSAKIKKNPL
jgi:16S rRNA (guanine527-N7)-methyltransferase